MRLSILKRSVFCFIAILLIISCQDDDSVTLKDELNNELDIQELILDWNALWLELDQNAFGMRPTATARSLAYIHLAAYETAVPEMQGYLSNTTKLDGLTIDAATKPNTIDLAIALNSCYAQVVKHFMYTLDIGQSSKIQTLRATKATALEEGLSETTIRDSEYWGLYVANQIIAYSDTDTAALNQIYDPQPLSYEPPTGEGYWTYSADAERGLFPYWGEVRTFIISSEQTSTVDPMIYSSEVGTPYYEQMMETYTLNNEAKLEDNENLWIAEFWSDDVEGLMVSPPGRQFSIAGQLSTQYDLSYQQTLALFLKLGFSLNDAAVSTWADKYAHMVMRPSVFIQEHIDTDYETNLYRFINWPNPTFPGYPSGHSAFASAAAGIFIDMFGDATNFIDRTHEGRVEFRGMPRQFASFSEMAVENGYSRIPLGVHIRMDCEEGLRLGYEVSDAINNYDITE